MTLRRFPIRIRRWMCFVLPWRIWRTVSKKTSSMKMKRQGWNAGFWNSRMTICERMSCLPKVSCVFYRIRSIRISCSIHWIWFIKRRTVREPMKQVSWWKRRASCFATVLIMQVKSVLWKRKSRQFTTTITYRKNDTVTESAFWWISRRIYRISRCPPWCCSRLWKMRCHTAYRILSRMERLWLR